MKVGILTFHFVHNEGAVLQCYALQRTLQELGHDPVVLDYRPSYHAVRYASKKNPFILARSNWKKNHSASVAKRLYFALRGFARAIIVTVKRADGLNESLFNAFITGNLILTKRYNSLKSLQKNPPNIDACVVGSDQLWNPDLLDQEFDSAYFMDFGSEKMKRIAYAVSLKQSYSDLEKAQLKKLCSNIDYLSIRESSDVFKGTTGRDVHICLDPSLLLDKEKYTLVESNTLVTKPYIFVYGFESTTEFAEMVRLVSNRHNLHVINGSPTRIVLDMPCEEVRDYAPDQFLSFIKNADYVITNSFHGTAFSIIYEKNFITFPHTTRGKRMTELLEKLGLTFRLYGTSDFSWETQIDFESVNEKLSKLREESKQFLINSLS